MNSVALDLIREVEESTDDTGFVTKVELRVNEALDEIATLTNWNHFHTRTTFNTVAGTSVYQLPAGAREIIQLRFTDNGSPIQHWTVQEAARRGIRLEVSGRPRAWLEDGNLVSGANVLYQFRLYPVPDSVLTIEREYYYHPSDVASASVLPIQDQYIVLVKDRVRAYLLEEVQKYEAADRAQRRYEAGLDRLVKQEKRKVAANTTLRPSDLVNIYRRPDAIFPPDHYDNWL